MYLCDDILNEIIHFSDIKTIINLKYVNKKFKKITENLIFYCVKDIYKTTFSGIDNKYDKEMNPVIVRGNHNNYCGLGITSADLIIDSAIIRIVIKIKGGALLFKNNLAKVKNPWLYSNYYKFDEENLENLKIIEVSDIDKFNCWNLELKYDNVCSRYLLQKEKYPNIYHITLPKRIPKPNCLEN